jgi:hypothetical protein
LTHQRPLRVISRNYSVKDLGGSFRRQSGSHR